MACARQRAISPTASDLCALTPVLMTPEHGNRVAEARRKTQIGGNLCPGPAQSSPVRCAPAPGSAQTARSPSMAPDQSL